MILLFQTAKLCCCLVLLLLFCLFFIRGRRDRSKPTLDSEGWAFVWDNSQVDEGAACEIMRTRVCVAARSASVSDLLPVGTPARHRWVCYLTDVSEMIGAARVTGCCSSRLWCGAGMCVSSFSIPVHSHLTDWMRCVLLGDWGTRCGSHFKRVISLWNHSGRHQTTNPRNVKIKWDFFPHHGSPSDSRPRDQRQITTVSLISFELSFVCCFRLKPSSS